MTVKWGKDADPVDLPTPGGNSEPPPQPEPGEPEVPR